MNNLHKIVNNIKISNEVVRNYDYQRIIDNLPFFLQLTKSFANNENIQNTLASSEKIRPRLSWYNPNDGMVPENWFKDGLLNDILYYKPFFKSS